MWQSNSIMVFSCFFLDIKDDIHTFNKPLRCVLCKSELFAFSHTYGKYMNLKESLCSLSIFATAFYPDET